MPLSVTDGLGVAFGELLAGEENNVLAAVRCFVCDGVQEVGLSQAGRPAEDQRVVAILLAGSDLARGAVGEPVAFDNSEGAEGQSRVQVGRWRPGKPPLPD